MKTALAGFKDPFILAILVILVLGILVPLPSGAISLLEHLGSYAVVLLFFLYGARLSTAEVWAGLKNVRVQGAVFACTFIIFPLLGVALWSLLTKLLGAPFALGLVYLCLLPSTVQSSVAFVSIARGNIGAAVCSATISNIIGMVITPLLVLLVMGKSSGVSLDSVRDVLLQLLLPFIVGQILQPRIGGFVRAHRPITTATDQITILLVVAAGIAGATAKGLWAHVTWAQVGLLIIASAFILTIMLLVSWYSSGALAFPLNDRIVVLMCGSKKSLATGLPMAAIIFPTTTVAAVTIPVIVFHQFQLIVCATLAQHLGRKERS
ncbi:MAG: bile acid:sodium symporter family protein [Actinomycetaceae bacterium]|nr:bile acid:sodium symporter family protein [Actinomycetaceae bacterium]